MRTIIEIRNKILREMLDREGLSDIHLYRGNGYFWVSSDGSNIDNEEALNALETTSIYLNSFRQQSVNDWFINIKNMVIEGYKRMNPKRKYHCELLSWSTMNPIWVSKENHELEVFSHEVCENYMEAVKRAKSWSKHTGEIINRIVTRELVEVSILCYTDERGFIEPFWIERFENGKSLGREDY